MNKNPLISIIMPAYNSEKTIRESIKSIINQSYTNWELLIIDNCSADRTYKIIEEYLDDKRIHYIKNDNNYGVAFSRNVAIKKAKGEYIAFLDSDDLWSKFKLEKQLHFMKKNNYQFTFTSNYIITEDNKIIETYHCPMQLDYKQLLKYNAIHTLTVMVKASILKENLMPNINDEDYATWLLIMKKGVIGYGMPEKLSYFRVTKGSMNSNKLKTLIRAYIVYRRGLNFSCLHSLFCLGRFVFYTIKKHLAYQEASKNYIMEGIE
jgi:teichuronic acid biosynthesis glycosyltransferase TuaG